MFDRCLFCFQAGRDPAGAVALARRIVPNPRHVQVLLHLHAMASFWSSRHEEESASALGWAADGLDPLLAGWAESSDGEIVEEFDLEVVRAAAERSRAEVVLVGPFGRALPRTLSWIEDVARRSGRPALFVAGEVGPAPGEARGRRILCPFESDVRTLAAAAVFLRERTGAADEVTLLALREPDPPLGPPEELADLAGIRARLSAERFQSGLAELPARFEARVAEGVDLVVLASGAVEGLTSLVLNLFGRELLVRLRAPVLVLPGRRGSALPEVWRGRLDAPDVLHLGGGALRIAAQRVDLLGQSSELEAIPLWVVSRGRLLGKVAIEAGMGELVLPADRAVPSALGLGREPSGELAGEPLAAVELRVSVVDPGPGRVWLLDAGLPPDALRALALVPAEGRLRAAIRLGSEPSFRGFREGLAGLGLRGVHVFDASAILDDGRPDDLPGGIEDVRLCRVAHRLRAFGVAVEAVVSGRGRPIGAGGYAFLLPADLGDPGLMDLVAGAYRPPVPRRGEPPAIDGVLDELTGSRLALGNRVEVELDNGRARRRLIDLIDTARERVHLEAFIVREDEVVRSFEEALSRAASRGVRVRFVVDSLWSFHHAFGLTNPVLDRLSVREGITVLPVKPIESFPNVEDLKVRDHRKTVVVDGATGIVSGRNLAASYYLGFDEVALAPESAHGEVPWLDAGVEVEGPLVEEIERAFHAVWRKAGGDDFEIRSRPPAGDVALRLVLHEGLRDAKTTDAYLALIRDAARDIVVVNTFPIQKEIAHALHEALGRGVRVRILVGHVRPVYGDSAIPFVGGALRELATQIVHGRLDGLVEAGAEVYELGLGGIPGWDERLGRVRPHIHAKIVSVDGRISTIGSANLDITAGYWDAEATVVIEDPRIATALEARIEGFLAMSFRIARDDPRWRQLASRRAWLSRNWPSIIG